jgi:hypothetical protein
MIGADCAWRAEVDVNMIGADFSVARNPDDRAREADHLVAGLDHHLPQADATDRFCQLFAR